MVSRLLEDVRLALRALASAPGFTVAATLTIALGIGVNSGVFSIFNGLVLRDLPVPEADELVAVSQQVAGVPRGTNNWGEFSTAEYRAYGAASETLAGVVAYGRLWMATLGGESARPVIATPVSCDYFAVLRRRPVVGPGLDPRHCAGPGDAAVAVIAHELWVDRFESDPAIVGKTVTVNGNVFEIVGVAPEGFAGVDIERSSLFVPLAAQRLLRPDRDYLENDSIGWLALIGRRSPEASLDEVRAELRVIAARLDQEQPGRRTTLDVSRATPVSNPEMRAGLVGASSLIMAAFGLVLLVACTNVANLMLARGDARMREIAIRLALGATRARLVGYLMTESLLIALAGGVLGTMFAIWVFGGLTAVALSSLPAEAQILRIVQAADVRVFAFALVTSLGTGVAFGLVPALRATRLELRTTIEQDSAAAGGHTRGRLQRTLVGVQVAFSMVLVIATALLLRGLYVAHTVDPGFDYRNLVAASLDLRAFGYEGARAEAFQRELIERTEALPGVEAVAQALLTPLEPRTRTAGYGLRGEDGTTLLQIATNVVSASYFSVMGIPIVRGRTFTETEMRSGTTTAVIVTESTARRLWPDEDALDQSLVVLLPVDGGFREQDAEVVGVARDVQVSRISESETSYVYAPAVTPTQGELQIVIRTSLGAAAIGAVIQDIARSLDPNLVAQARPVEWNLEFWRSLSRIAVGLALSLGALALALAAIGIFGVMSTVVGRRIREIGVRMALGASRPDIVRVVLRRSLSPVLVGALVGAAGSFAVSRLLSGLLYGVSPLDPYALVGALLVVIVAAVAAAFLPARRATSVDPMASLRYE